ncbi:MAG: chlorite dismutase family protein [Anaerolineales bacterium]|nr:chlorite dismutase family protein [Anaerolineales bacterium]
MSEELMRSLNQFIGYQFTQSFWDLEDGQRDEILDDLTGVLERLSEGVYLYRVFPADGNMDFLIWSASRLQSELSSAQYFETYAKELNPYRRYIRAVENLWGYTGKSTYSRAQSAQEIDPFAGERPTYLVVYPFVKTKEWYLMGRDARQGMMNEHIRLGKGYPQIKQLLLYSFGVQDQEFVVVYEMDDLPLFSDLVHELRSTEARRFTELDTPLITATHLKNFEAWRSSC